jgi:glutaminyl-tRNA synthetase
MEEEKKSLNFIEQFIEEDIENGKHGGRIHTRFPPEPNGFLHIGHAKSICLNFGIAEKYNGVCNLRFDDTNPSTEKVDYVNSIKDDIHWLGFDWGDREYYTSDYFSQLFDYAIILIKKGLAYVEDASADEINEMRGNTMVPGRRSEFSERSVEENLDLFHKMREGKFPDGSKVLRAKIDMASSNMHMRDPVLYRIKHETHHRSGDEWCIYPMYDFAHGQSDSIEDITHSLCTLEFENHRPLYNWFIEKLEIFPSRQIEFARLNLSHTIMSKRKLLKLVEEGVVNGWDDPRLPTISGLKRRGYTPESIRSFAEGVGIAKRENVIEHSFLEHHVREHLNKIATRVMGVIDPLKVVIENWPEDQVDWMEATNNPEDPDAGTRKMPFTKELFIDRDDFMIDPPKKYFRMAPERNVRLKHGYILNCKGYELDEATGEVNKVICTYYPDSRSGSDNSGVKAKGTIHWVSSEYGVPAELRLYDSLFSDPAPDSHDGKDFMDFINQESLVIKQGIVEPHLKDAQMDDRYQFLRRGYYCLDQTSTSDNLVFNRTVTLKASWTKKKN